MTRVDAEILTIEDLATLFACDKETAAARLKCGDFPGIKVGRGWIIPRAALFERINEMAREESATRRAELGSKCQEIHREYENERAASPLATRTSVLLLPTAAPKSRRRGRREPPPLPPVPTKN